VKIPKLCQPNLELKPLPILLYFILFVIMFSFLNFQLIYSQSLEDPKSPNCKDNHDQSQYVTDVAAVNNSDRVEPNTDNLPGFHYVKKFDSNGTLISAWGTKGTGPGQFLHAHGITTDSNGNVYVNDAEKCNIQKFDSEGKFITMWGTKGTGPGKFYQPESMAVDSKGNVFVADFDNQYIQKFDSEGKFITMWGSKGTEDGQFTKLWGVAVDSNDNVYTSDQGNPEVQKFDNDGKFLTKWNSYSADRLFVHLHAVTTDSNDFVYVTDGRNNSRVAKFSPQGDFITQWGAFGSGDGRFIEDHGIATDQSGNVYVVDTRNVRIQKFDSEGDFVTKWGTLGCGDNQFLIPHDIAIDASGNIYVSDSGNVHFLADETCQTLEGKNWTTSIRKLYTSTMSGDKHAPPVVTDVIGNMSISVPQDESEIKYKIEITGTSDISSAYIHIGKDGENGEAVADLLKDSKKNDREQTGVVIRGEVLDSDLVGSMNGKSLHDLINAMTDGQTYVNFNTPTHIKGEIRGQIEVSKGSMGS
jgi:sugar lactone lactonase YvrE